MKTRIARVAGMVAAGLFFAGTALALPTLIFIDDFTDDDVRNSSPVPGEGGGLIGGSSHYHVFVADGNWGTSAVENGYLKITSGHATSSSSVSYIRTGSGRSEYNFMNMGVGEGMLMQVFDFSMDWANQRGRFNSGFMTSGRADRSSNAVYYIVHGDTGVIDFYAKDTGDGAGSLMGSLSPQAAERPVRIDLYCDSLHYSATVYYSNDTVQELAPVAHNLDGELIGNALRLYFDVEPRSAGITSFASMSEVRVTQIPEPGSLFLMGILGAGLVARKRLRR